jgi:nucleotide-binding universal stress UspA family protein
MINKILVGIDGSEPSLFALDYAADLAETNGSELLILSIINRGLIVSIDEYNPQYLPELLNDLEKHHQRIIENAAERVIKSHPDIKTTTSVKEGNPSKLIIDTAREEDVDLIVIGNKGTGGIVNWLLGGTSRNVVEACTVPVLVVKNRQFCELKES